MNEDFLNFVRENIKLLQTIFNCPIVVDKKLKYYKYISTVENICELILVDQKDQEAIVNIRREEVYFIDDINSDNFKLEIIREKNGENTEFFRKKFGIFTEKPRNISGSLQKKYMNFTEVEAEKMAEKIGNIVSIYENYSGETRKYAKAIEQKLNRIFNLTNKQETLLKYVDFYFEKYITKINLENPVPLLELYDEKLKSTIAKIGRRKDQNKIDASKASIKKIIKNSLKIFLLVLGLTIIGTGIYNYNFFRGKFETLKIADTVQIKYLNSDEAEKLIQIYEKNTNPVSAWRRDHFIKYLLTVPVNIAPEIILNKIDSLNNNLNK